MKKKLALLNTFSVILVIAINYASQIYRFNDTTVGEVSKTYDNLFTPAGYAFSIWGIIFLSLLGYVAFQIKRAFFSSKKADFITQTSYWFALTNFLNCAWVFAFSYDVLWLSVILIFAMLFCLLKIVLRTNMERWDAPIQLIAFVWWPICLYAGWIAVATIANTAAFFVQLGVVGGELSQIIWTMVMITVAVFINLLMINMRNMREFAAVGAWALIAIFIKHKDNLESVAYYALLGAILLIIAAGIHGFKNRKTNPFKKLKEAL